MNEKKFGYDAIMADITPGLQKTFKNKRKIKIYQWGGDNKADMLTPGMIGIYAIISLEPKKEIEDLKGFADTIEYDHESDTVTFVTLKKRDLFFRTDDFYEYLRRLDTILEMT